ncbi:D-glycerate dehydrogenase [Maritimibacter sp. UBA3975]|uniref:2-hydroxyacid dehydrogenase n=1 Tax=Maritimibacter sp. UBA3975 TaxID=1946833 RepID=UPI000C098B32|nr:D-glycerate dehydrogenase [Maritimibacter sp. UBA3975]MAM61991.1 D-glycerate dehydrogenase [Maritimibacter sp.]|tara:strand:+ start:14979 stop:15932 length:954 start_codon:yes stop_codon:yes gene_type:complete
MAEILITRPLPDAVVARLSDRHDVTLRETSDPLDADELITALTSFDAVLPTLGDAFSAEVFEAAGDIRCKLLANFGVGYNHIDAAAAKEHGVAVTNTPGTVTDATADIALTLILMTARRAGEGERFVRAGKWVGWNPMQMLGMHVTGKTLGIIGMGRIGQAIAKRCHYGFDMNVIFYNRSPKRCDFPARQYESIGDVAALADILVVAVPGGPETHHLIGREVFAQMPDGAIFVNISRGDVVDEPALIAALEAGDIRGAGLDVYENEPHVPEALRAMENVTLLPHLGTAALEVREAMGLMAADNILSFLDTGELLNPV